MKKDIPLQNLKNYQNDLLGILVLMEPNMGKHNCGLDGSQSFAQVEPT